MAKSFDELVAGTTTRSVRAKAEALTRRYLAEMLLSEIRLRVGKSQTELAQILGVKQPGLSRLEKQDDMQVSTLKRIVEALGGKLVIVASFPKADVAVSQFDSEPRKLPKKKVRELQELQLV